MNFDDLLEVARAEDKVGEFIYDYIVAELKLTALTGRAKWLTHTKR